MTKPNGLKTGCVLLMLCAVTVSSARAQTVTTLYSFSGFDGASPYQAPLIQGQDGNLYGTTASGGSATGGTIFKITTQGVLTTLYNFCTQSNCPDGTAPFAGLALADDGNFYGTTLSGGANGWGTVYKVTPDGVLTTLHSFCFETNCADGASPYGGLVQATDGNLYGTTEQGGPTGRGTVFRITVEGVFTIIHNFCVHYPHCEDGYAPMGTLIQATDGNLYGTTASGGARNQGGTVFSIGRHGAFDYVELQDSGAGGGPVGGVLQVSGRLYGTTYNSLVKGAGTLFGVDRDKTAKTLYWFCVSEDCSDGAIPTAALVQATDGSVYGTTSKGGDLGCMSPAGNGCGTIFQIAPGRKFVTVHTFEASDGSLPNAGLFQATNGILYGVTSSGGDGVECGIYGCGTIYSLDTGLGPFVAFVQGAGKVGSSSGILGQGFIGTTTVSFNGTPATFTVQSDTFILGTVPNGATTGYVTVSTPKGTLTSNKPFIVLP